jgi:type I restriction enzyme S subunit
MGGGEAGEVVELIRNGLTVSQNKDDKGVPVTRIETISEEKIDQNKVGFVENVSDVELNEYRLLNSDILFSHINSLKHIGKTAIYEGAPPLILHGMNLLLLRPKNEVVNPYYFLYLLKYFRIKAIFKNMSKKAVNQASINQTELSRVKIPLPSLPEQRKIASILSTIDDAIQKVDDAIAKTGRLKKGLMQDLLTRGIGHERFKYSKELGCEIPEEWEVVRLGDMVMYKKGIKPKTLLNQKEQDTFPYLTAEALRMGIFNQWARKTDEFVKVNKDDIILIWDGFYCGDAFIGFEGILSSTMIKIEPKLSLDKHFLFYYLKTHFKELNTKISGMYLKHVNKSVFESLKIPLPKDISEQQNVAEILSTVDKKLELERKRKEKFERIKRGLMNDLLTGRKRVRVAG